jgi:hypothetical protein
MLVFLYMFIIGPIFHVWEKTCLFCIWSCLISLNMKLVSRKQTGVLNKLQVWVWVWHSPKPQQGTSIVMPSKIARLIFSLSCRSGQDAVQLFFPLKFMFGEKLSQVPPVAKGITGHVPFPKKCLSTQSCYWFNKHTGDGRWWCVSIWAHSLLGPSFIHILSSLLSFLHLQSPQVRYLGQACVWC